MTGDDLWRISAAVVAAAAMLVAVALGPLALDVVHYRVSAAARAQYVGAEIVNAVAALALVAAAFGPRTAGRCALQAGAAAYLVYNAVTVVLGQEYLVRPGDGERLFPLFVLVTTGAGLTFAAATRELLTRTDTLTAGPATRITAVVVALLFAALWIAQLAANARTPSADYLDGPQLFWLVKYIDLAVVIPAALLAAARWTPEHRVVALLVLAFTVWMAGAIAAMQVGMVALHLAPARTLAVAAGMVAVAAWSAIVVVRAVGAP